MYAIHTSRASKEVHLTSCHASSLGAVHERADGHPQLLLLVPLYCVHMLLGTHSVRYTVMKGAAIHMWHNIDMQSC